MENILSNNQTQTTTMENTNESAIQNFTTIGKSHGAPCIPATKEDWEGLRREPWLADMCARIERGDAELKHKLPVWTPSCAEFADNHRAKADALRPLRRLMMDFDEKGHTDDILRSLIPYRNQKEEGAEKDATTSEIKVGALTILLVEDSVRRGSHVLVEIPEGMTAEEAQHIMQEATGFEPDKAVKDVARCIYMVPENYTRYVSERLWTPSTLDPRPSTLDPRPSTLDPRPSTLDSRLSTFKGIPYSTIIAEYWHRTGGEPAEGERNVKLHKLAANLRSICDNKKDVLIAVMPHFGLSDAELTSIVDSACKEQPKGISKIMQDIVDSLLRETEKAKARENEDNWTEEEADSRPSTTDPRLKRLPIGLKESLVGVPPTMHMPVLCTVLPIAAAYADQVEVEYCDGNRQKLGLMSIIRGEQASGKSVCKMAVDIWKRQFDEEDAIARRREEEWKERKKSRKANEKAPDDPRVLIRTLPVTVSCSTLLRRMKNADGHCLYSFCEELDTLRKPNGAGSWSSKYDIYRLAFDRGEWGQDYNSDQAESGVVKVAYNWTMLGTNGAMRKCFRQDNIENGLSSRVLISEMPDSSFTKMPKYGRRSAEEEARIQDAVTKLRSYSGFIDTPRLRKTIERWVEEKRVEAAKDIDYVKDTYRKRAAVIGFRCGVIHHLLSSSPNSDKGEAAATLRFATMMAQYCLDQQIAAFGTSLQKEYVNAKDECQRYGSNHSIFDQLAPVFTMNDLRALKQNYCSDGSLYKIISRWHHDKWIEKIDRNHWKKQQ